MALSYLFADPGVDILPLSTGSSGNPGATCVITGVNAPVGATVVVWVAEGNGAATPGSISDGANTYSIGAQQNLPAGIGAMFCAQNITALSNGTITYTKRGSGHNCSMTAMVIAPLPGVALDLDTAFGVAMTGVGTVPILISGAPSRRQTIVLGGVFYTGPTAGISFALPAGPIWAMPPYPRNSYPDAQVGGGWVINGGTKPVTFAPALGGATANWAAMMIGFSITPEPTRGWYGVLPHQPNTPYAPNALVRQNSIPGFGNHRVFQSSGGTSGAVEPSWALGRDATTLDGGVVWTEVTGQAADRPFADLLGAAPRLASADRLLADHNNLEVWGPNTVNSRYAPTFPTVVPLPQVYSVDAAGSLSEGATFHVLPSAVAASIVNSLNIYGAAYFEGVTFHFGSGSFVYSVSNDYKGMQAYRKCRYIFSGLCTFGWDNNGPAYAVDCEFIGAPYIGTTSVAAIQVSHGAKISRVKFSGKWNSVYLFAAYQTAQPSGEVEDSDASGVITNSLVQSDRNNNSMSNVPYIFKRCTLSPSMPIGQNKFGIENRIDIIECGPAAPVARLERWTGQGSHVRDTAVVRSGGSNVGGIPVSWAFRTTGFISWPLPFYSIPLPLPKCFGSRMTICGMGNFASMPTDAQLWLDIITSMPDPIFSTGTSSGLTAGVPLDSDDSSVWDSGVPNRQNDTDYSTDQIFSVPNNYRAFFCITPGRTAVSLPAGYGAVVDGGTITDGTATFRAGTRFLIGIDLPQAPIEVILKTSLPYAAFWLDPPG